MKIRHDICAHSNVVNRHIDSHFKGFMKRTKNQVEKRVVCKGFEGC